LTLPHSLLALALGLALSPVADAQLSFSRSLLSGTISDVAAVTIDPSGNTYMTGWIRNANLPVTPGAVQPRFGGGDSDAFALKLDKGGNIVFATYLGGRDTENPSAISVDSDGNVYIAGVSRSADFPTTPGAASRVGSPVAASGFIVKLNPTGTAFVYSTLVPGGGKGEFAIDGIPGLAIDGQGNAWFSGTVDSSDRSFPATTGAYLTTPQGGRTDAVAVKLNPSGTAFLYATYIGGTGDDLSTGVAVDAAGNAYFVGWSNSSNFPVTAGAYNPAVPAGGAIFVLRLDALGKQPGLSTFLGPSAGAFLNRIRLDAQGNIYLFGIAAGQGFPVTPGSFQTSPSDAPWWDPASDGVGFVSKLNPIGTTLLYSTLFAGAGRFEVDASGRAFVSGIAKRGLPVSRGAVQRCLGGGNSDIFLAEITAQGKLAAATYLGGTGYEYTRALATDSSGALYLVSSASAADAYFPGLPNTVPFEGGLVLSRLNISDPAKTDVPCLTPVLQNGATFSEGPVAAGELVTLNGLDMGPVAGTAMQIDSTGHIATQLAGVRVFVNESPVPLLYVQSRQINAQVPWELAGQPSAQVRVEYQGVSSNTIAVALDPASPGIFLVPATPDPLPAVLNQDGTLNAPGNPASGGSFVTIFGTGSGPATPPGITGAATPIAPTFSLLNMPVFVVFNQRIRTEVQYAGLAPTLVSGVFQVNVRVPPIFSPGTLNVTLGVGAQAMHFRISVR
jgi:uncharacterized protein (TIGR03437 family)